MTRPTKPWTRWSLRTRLLASVVVGMLIAIGCLVLAFNLVLGSRLDNEADDLARARAAAEVSALVLAGDRIQIPEGPDARNPDPEVWVFQYDRPLERPQTSVAVDAAATRLARVAPRFADLPRTDTRLYAAPVGQSRKIGSVVVGVNLGPYEQIRHTALIASTILGGVILVLVAFAARWLITRALKPVAAMTGQAAEWSEHNLDGRFTPGLAEDEIALLAETLNGLLVRLGASLRREQRLSAEISHELRTPLAGLIAEVQFAQRHGVQGETLDRILDDARRLGGTLDTLMAAARAEYSPHGSRADAVACATAALDAARGLRPPEAVTLSVNASGAPWVGVDEALVQRILAPLIENAIRYADSAVMVRIRREDDAIRLTVEDDGPGVPAEEREVIFKPGHHSAVAGTGTVMRSSGAGLGLALCRRLASSVGGDVRLEPGEDGARFTVRLPAA